LIEPSPQRHDLAEKMLVRFFGGQGG